MRRGGRPILFLVFAVLFLAACGAPADPAAPTTDGSPGSTVTPGPGGYIDLTMDEVRLEPDGRTVAFRATFASGDGPECRGGIVAAPVPNTTAAEERRARSIWVRVSYDGQAYQQQPGACPAARTTVTRLRLSRPLGRWTLLVQDFGYDGTLSYVADGTTPSPVLHRCGPYGCHPDPFGCNETSYAQAVGRPETTKDTHEHVQLCQDGWLVIDFSTRAGPVCEDPGDACPTLPGTRVFFRAENEAWVGVYGTQEPGCATVNDQVPGFPRRFCENLPAL